MIYRKMSIGLNDNKIKSFRVNGKLRKIIKKCTKINPKDRYQNCIDLLCDIKKLA